MIAETLSPDAAAEAARRTVAMYARLAIHAIRLACDLHAVDFKAIVAREVKRP